MRGFYSHVRSSVFLFFFPTGLGLLCQHLYAVREKLMCIESNQEIEKKKKKEWTVS